ncbi:MAG: hypothetical protein L6Q81_07765 [Bacteroidia bacterium]|nr:hypothetical protein [Bacteroidia bacterium]
MMLRRFILLIVLFCAAEVAGQNDVRRLIDMDRRNIQYNSKEALDKSREYIRKDSLYYIGYMYEGAYRYFRANDELGYRQAIIPLEKAMRLVEREYDSELRTRTSNLGEYYQVSTYQNDYCQIADWLTTCYQNIEQADSAFSVMMRVKDRDMQYEGAADSWNTLAWIYHRNRMYTSERFAFLKNTVHENDSMAYACLDSAIAKTHRDNELCQGLFDPTWMNSRYYFTYHYKVILFTYDFKIDSADYYYDILLQSGYYSSNNYANYQYMKGEFGIAEQFYREAETRDATIDKHTREYYYMRGLLDINAARPERSDSLLSAVIRKDGATPGFGWHSIAYARALTYEGLTSLSQNRLNAAAGFQELHIGTTWGQEQYNLAVAMLNYINAEQHEAEYYFENDEWYFWLNPFNWYKWFEFRIKQHHLRLVLVSLVASNPERADVLYPVFSSENVMSWDENFRMLDGFSNDYFIRYYEELLEKDPRDGVKMYIRYMLGRLHISEGEESRAREYLEAVYFATAAGNYEYDNLLYYRTCEALAQISDGDEKQKWLQKAFLRYSRLMPTGKEQMKFTVLVNGTVYIPSQDDFIFRMVSFAMPAIIVLFALYLVMRRYFRLRHNVKRVSLIVAGLWVSCLVIWVFSYSSITDEGTEQRVVRSFGSCNIGFTDTQDVPVIKLSFSKSDSTHIAKYEVVDVSGEPIRNGELIIEPDKPETAGILLAYRIFDVNYTYDNLNEAIIVAEDENAAKLVDSLQKNTVKPQ